MYDLASPSSTGGLIRTARSACYALGAALLTTGGIVVTSSPERLQSYYKEVDSHLTDLNASKSSKIDARSPQQHLANIKTIFALPISEIAHALGVTRQSVYKWISASAVPDDDNLKKLEDLSKVADKFASAGFDRAGALLSVKVSGEHSVLELLALGKSVHEYIPGLLAEAVAINQSYESGVMRKTQMPVHSEWKSNVSIPAASES
ncbi:MAG: helix-turn-helix domain-containing protein [Pseudomonadaceae bacterium]